MKLTDKRQVIKRIAAVRKVVAAEIAANAAGGSFAAGLSTEGFAGGYLAALDDIDAALEHGYPSDHRGYWRAADRAVSSGNGGSDG
jgi:hypothetical protein